MSVLAIDTATSFLCLGFEQGGNFFEKAISLERAHAERISLEVELFFEENQQPFRAEKIVVGIGPGSYTGVRVGASYALGLARAWGVPTVGVGSLEGIAASVNLPEMQNVAACMDARKGFVYGGIFQVSSGLIVRNLLEGQKLERVAFEHKALELSAVLLEQEYPSGAGLIRVAEVLGKRDWEVTYL
jgi:tRNA threonylcarbamoyladenosine biosynthesis protein TsaB